MKVERGKAVQRTKEFFPRGGDFFRRIRQWLSTRTRPWGVRRQRQLRLCENLALGERRFLSVVECGQQRFLLGGSANSLVVLAELANDASSGPKKDGEDVPTYKLVGGDLTKDVLCG
jgi:Flagellar biosynthesis protein, FliO